MRKYLILTILFSCLHIAARGQTIASLDDIDLSGLPKATKAKALHYWVDDDDGNVRTVTQLSGQLTLDVSALTEGLHTLHYQIVDENDDMASVSSTVFLKTGNLFAAPSAKQLRYWYDDDSNTAKTVTTWNDIHTIDASALVDGLHTLHYQVIGSDNVGYGIASELFLKMNDIGTTGNMTARKLMYWFDDETDVKTIDATKGIQMLNASHLVDGLHTIHYQVLCSNGLMTSSMSSIFLRMSTGTEATIAKSLRYWFDDDIATLKVTDASNGTQNIDVTSLVSGLHTLYYQLVDNSGKVSPPVATIFLKDFAKVAADGENHITKFQYWLNDESEELQTVMLDNDMNPYTLIDLLPLHKEPIRSRLFQFEITNGQPTLYAKNEFHIRFHDTAEYFADDFRTYVDYDVKQPLVDFELLESGIRATTVKPAENTIKWYCVTAEEPGDSLQFRLDRTATVQLFAPSGEELLSVSGSDVVNWFGCHVREAGTYYLALHDVTATWGDDISIDYNLIDKYAVLRQDVSVVGNGGCSTITFEGNGFQNLYDVELFNEQGDIIPQLYIGHESNATTSVVFDFTDIALGTYHARFRFAEEDKEYENLLMVEEPRDIELATTVTYPTQFLRGSSTTYTIKITNKGNMTAYYVPVYTYIKTSTIDAVTHIDYEGMDLPGIYSQVDLSGFSTTELQELREIEKRIGATPYFIPVKVAEGNDTDSVIVRSGLFFVNIAPNSTKELKLSINSTEIVEAWLSIPDEWNIMNSANCANARLQSPIEDISTAEKYFCCYKETIECLLETQAAVLDVASFVCTLLTVGQPELAGTPALVALAIALKGCQITIAANQLKGFGNALCNSDKEDIMDRILEGLKSAVKSTINISSVISCVGAAISGANLKLADGTTKIVLKTLGEALSSGAILNDWLNAVMGKSSCESMMKPKPNCPPNPPKGGPSSPVNSLDPNDIYGYAASSGSHAVMDGQTDVYYRIEFENDTAFATASAHDIYVTDTLDATNFDLSTFVPTRVKIGEKSAELTGDKNFVTTIDMRPSINAIAQVEGTYDEKRGIAKWHISSLDPMTMEPTKYVIDGVLPVNTDGRGIGEVMYDIKLKPSLAHGTEINNRAGIVFDTNDVIMTPTWTNTIDRVKPVSRITKVEQVDGGETATVSIEATDDGSGPWRYNVYVQYGSGAWFPAAENVAADTTATVKLYEGIEHHFYCVATDMAGNVEQKEPTAEATLNVGTIIPKGDLNGDGQVTSADVWTLMGIIARGGTMAENLRADVNGDGRIDIGDVTSVIAIMAR